MDLLEITDYEMKSMTTIISKNEKYDRNNQKRRAKRRNSEGLTKREQQKREKLINVLRGILNNKTNKEIADELNISLRMVQVYKKELNEDVKLKSELTEIINKEVDEVSELCELDNLIDVKTIDYMNDEENRLFSNLSMSKGG